MAGTDGRLGRSSLQAGMQVRDSQGTRLGYVARLGESHLFLRRHRYARHWSAVPLSRVARLVGYTVYLDAPGSQVLEPAEPYLGSELLTYTLPLAWLPRAESTAGRSA